jgi:hypothetical protein
MVTAMVTTPDTHAALLSSLIFIREPNRLPLSAAHLYQPTPTAGASISSLSSGTLGVLNRLRG